MTGMSYPTVDEDFLLRLLQACAERAPLYPKQFAQESNLPRDLLDQGLDELRRRGLIKLSDWVKDQGQGCVPTDAGLLALKTKRLTPAASTSAQASPTQAAGTYARGELVRAAVFAPRRGYVTRVLLAANVLYFLYGAFFAWQHDLPVNEYLAGDSRVCNLVLGELGGLWPPVTVPDAGVTERRPEFERIILSFFLHIGILHLLLNMYFLVMIGQLIETMWGSVRFLVIYFTAGIVGSCAVLLITHLEHLAPRDTPLTAGASGCMFGLFAALIVWFALNYQHLPPNVIQAWSRNIAINLALLVAINFVATVSWQGHLGGALGGFLAALFLHVQRFNPSAAVRFLALLCVPLVPVGFFLAVLWQAGRL